MALLAAASRLLASRAAAAATSASASASVVYSAVTSATAATSIGPFRGVCATPKVLAGLQDFFEVPELIETEDKKPLIGNVPLSHSYFALLGSGRAITGSSGLPGLCRQLFGLCELPQFVSHPPEPLGRSCWLLCSGWLLTASEFEPTFRLAADLHKIVLFRKGLGSR